MLVLKAHQRDSSHNEEMTNFMLNRGRLSINAPTVGISLHSSAKGVDLLAADGGWKVAACRAETWIETDRASDSVRFYSQRAPTHSLGTGVILS